MQLRGSVRVALAPRGERVSFDLDFVVEGDAVPDISAKLQQWLEQYRWFRRNAVPFGGTEHFYASEDTGVYFQLLDESGANASDEKPNPPEGFRHSGWSFNLNYCRPSFFASEAIPIAVDFAATMSLRIHDPQDGRITNDPDLLMAAWRRHNRSGVAALIADHERQGRPSPVTILERAWLDRIWEFNRSRTALQTRLGPDIFVARITLIRSPVNGAIARMAVWPVSLPALMPEVDFVFLAAERKRFLGLGGGIRMTSVPWAGFMDACRALAREQDGGIAVLGSASELRKSFSAARRSSGAMTITAQGQAVDMQEITDSIELPGP
jgi:hypothetical protein